MASSGAMESNIVCNYAGDVSTKQTWQALSDNPKAQLIDVRTQPEWVFSGAPELTEISKKTHLISWKIYPTMQVNAQFVQMVQAIAPDPQTPIYFLCKTGGRSSDAAYAMTQAGYTQCYNIEHGFEGAKNDRGQRGTINGWKATSLPWEQA